jgi:hypothetical protein
MNQLEELPVVDGLTLKIIVLYFKFNFCLPLIFTLITDHFVKSDKPTKHKIRQNIYGYGVANSRIKNVLNSIAKTNSSS